MRASSIGDWCRRMHRLQQQLGILRRISRAFSEKGGKRRGEGPVRLNSRSGPALAVADEQRRETQIGRWLCQSKCTSW